MPNFILIDGSYFIFYRYFAIQNWFKFSHKNEILDNPVKNNDFVEGGDFLMFRQRVREQEWLVKKSIG